MILSYQEVNSPDRTRPIAELRDEGEFNTFSTVKEFFSLRPMSKFNIAPMPASSLVINGLVVQKVGIGFTGILIIILHLQKRIRKCNM